MKNKFANTTFYTLLIAVLTCGISNLTYAQTAEYNQKQLEIKSEFFGRWAAVKDPNHILEIYKEGSLIVVQRRSEINDGTKSNKYTVLYQDGNKIRVDLGNGSTPLTINNEGNKITFLGDEYTKK